MERWCDLNPIRGLSSAFGNIVGSLKSSGLATWEELYFDEYLQQHGHSIDAILINKCVRERPDAIVVNFYPFVDDTRNIRFDTLCTLKNMGIPLIFIWFDFVHPHIQQLASSLAEFGKVNVVVDIGCGEPFMFLWVPQDEEVFTNPNCHRDIDVSFIGSTYPDRHNWIGQISQHINLFRSGGQREHNVSVAEYANFLQRSKITINFCGKPPHNYIQAKARIYEAMRCGTLLLEQNNAEIEKWFVPNEHYVPFFSPEDLVARIRSYLQDHAERERISSNGYRKMSVDYSSKEWWRRVLERAL